MVTSRACKIWCPVRTRPCFHPFVYRNFRIDLNITVITLGALHGPAAACITNYCPHMKPAVWTVLVVCFLALSTGQHLITRWTHHHRLKLATPDITKSTMCWLYYLLDSKGGWETILMGTGGSRGSWVCGVLMRAGTAGVRSFCISSVSVLLCEGLGDKEMHDRSAEA